ncbi:hypothetical protein [Sciscionella sediminilitoris]|uniref:hypothetical protein n=1 Tax=Sciscionella sediminilitoris TaxID=1445613 RepID=UPI0004DF5192|nr:hypothetical protein [Sciscionella sp. SE31]
MAIPGGYRFPVPFDDVFPEGAFVLGVEQVFDYDNNGGKSPAKDKQSGKLVWGVQVTDPSARGKNTGVVVKIDADVQPVPPETAPGLPFRPVVFEGLTATAYEQNGRVQFSLRAKEMHAPGKATGTKSAAAQGNAEQKAA